MGFGGFILLVILVAFGWGIIRYGIRVSDEAKVEDEARAERKKISDAINEVEKVRSEVTKDLNDIWDKAHSEYVNAVQSGDKFLATAKGRDFYARNRRFSGTRTQSQVIADEIRIKNEVSKGRVGHIPTLNLEELDLEEFRDRINSLAK